MKKTVKILSFLLALIFTLSLFTACGDDVVVEQDGPKEYFTIQWVWGQKVLKEERVEKGTKLTSWIPQIEGKEFQAWYERPYIKKFDFEKAVTKSMRIYASFVSNDGDEGGSSGSTEKVYLVVDSNWSVAPLMAAWAWPGSDTFLMPIPTEDPNVYEFEIPEGATNILFVCFNEGTSDPNWEFENKSLKTHDLGLPKAGSDKIYFHVSNNSWSSSSTEPGEAGDTGVGGGAGGPADIIFIGTFTGWATDNSDPAYALTKGEDGVWRGTQTFAEQVEMKLYDKGGSNGSGGWIASPVGTGENGNLILQAGTYHFKFTEGSSGFIYWAEGEDEPADLPAGGDSSNSGGSSDVPISPLPEGEGMLVFFVNNWLWTDIKCYYWGDEVTTPEFPGDAMVKVGVTDTSDGVRDVYAIKVPTGTTGIIFSGVKNDASGNRDQTPDITSGIVEGAAWKMNWADGNIAEPVDYTYAP